MARVTDVLTHTKGCSSGLDASQVPPSFAGAREVFDSELTDFAISSGKLSGCHGTCRYRIRPFTRRLSRREEETDCG